MLYKKKATTGWFMNIDISPNSSKNQIQKVVNNRLKIRIQKPAEKSKANKELIKFLSKEWGVPKREIKIVSGEKSAKKKIHINREDFDITCKCSQ